VEFEQNGTKPGLVVPVQQGSRFILLHKFKITDTYSQTIKTPNLQPTKRHDVTGPIYIQLAKVYKIHISFLHRITSAASVLLMAESFIAMHILVPTLTLWRRNYFFLFLAHPVYKM